MMRSVAQQEVFPSVVGIEWQQSSINGLIWRRIDINGQLIPFPYSFNNIYPWAGMRRVTMAANGNITGVGNGKGTGLDLTGAAGRVMVEIPKFYVKSKQSAPGVYQWWISSVDLPDFVVHPAFVQRGGIERPYIYVGAYDADFEYNGANAAYAAANEQLHSRTGKQPYTGSADCVWVVNFDGGQNEPVVGNSLSTPTTAGLILIDYLKTGGTWAGGDAAGKLWIVKPGIIASGWLDNETITNTTLANTLAGGAGLGVNGAITGESVTISRCRTLAGQIGTNWGIVNIWSLSAIQLLFYAEYAGANSQILVGQGIVNKAGGTGFNGEISGFDTADTNIAVNGTGKGTGVDGVTPIVYRGIENLWGNIYQFIDGYIVVDAAYQIIRRDGLGTLATPMAVGSYEASLATPGLVSGYISDIEQSPLLKYLFIPKGVVGASNTYLCDYLYAHVAGNVNILLAGSDWTNGAPAGFATRNSTSVAGDAYRHLGARLEFIGSN